MLSLPILGLLGLVLFLAIALWLLQPAAPVPPFEPKNSPISMKECKERLKKRILSSCPATGNAYLVIGGGFLGSRIIESLLIRGEKKVNVFDNSPTCVWANDKRVTYTQGDITKYSDVLAACGNIDTVYLTAAAITFMDKIPYQYEKSFVINVIGCENVIKACIDCEVNYLIQTSTFHVTVPCAGKKGVIEVNEEDPYVNQDSCTSYYAATKALAEQLVLRAHGSVHPNNVTELNTISIRPPGIFGARDHLVVEDMLKNKEYMFLGFTSYMDWSYVDNVAYAHLLGEANLRKNLVKAGGQAFLITDGEPYFNNDFRRMVLYYSGGKFAYGPQRLIWVLSYIIELAQRLLKHKFPKLNPPLSYFTYTAIKIMDYDVTVKSDKISRILGYRPIFSVEEGIQLSILEHKDPSKNFIYSP